jgi:hypothetical protein
MTLAVVGVTVMATPDELPLPHPSAPSAAANAAMATNLHPLILILPRFPIASDLEPNTKFRPATSAIKTCGSL